MAEKSIAIRKAEPSAHRSGRLIHLRRVAQRTTAYRLASRSSKTRSQYPELIRHFESKLHLVPRYRQRLIPVPFNLDHATLEDDPDFTIENHVKFHQLPVDTSEAQLIEAAMAVFRKPLDRNRPLWEVNLFNGFKGNRSRPDVVDSPLPGRWRLRNGAAERGDGLPAGPAGARIEC